MILKSKECLKELSRLCQEVQDRDITKLFDQGALDELMTSILDTSQCHNFPSIADFFLENKNRSSLVAAIRRAITRSYSIKVTVEGNIGYVSPSDVQWFDKGVMIFEGQEPFSGLIAYYDGKKVSFAMAGRDIQSGEIIGPNDFNFVDVETTRKHFAQLQSKSKSDLDSPLIELKALLNSSCSDESKYQDLFARHPWTLGLQYKQIQRHEALDDQNIPDFHGIRVIDGCRDIIELKPPTLNVCTQAGELSAPFNQAWNQVERYLTFAREQRDYLQGSKGLRFDNPKAFLICGQNLRPQTIQLIRLKEKMNPAIHFMSFNDVISLMESVTNFVNQRIANNK